MAKVRLQDKTLVSATGVTSTNTSSSVDLTEVASGFAVQSVLTETAATLAGTAYLQASLDNTTFVTVSGSSQTISGSSNLIWNVANPHYKHFRVVHDVTGGTATIVCKIVVNGEDF